MPTKANGWVIGRREKDERKRGKRENMTNRKKTETVPLQTVIAMEPTLIIKYIRKSKGLETLKEPLDSK